VHQCPALLHVCVCLVCTDVLLAEQQLLLDHQLHGAEGLIQPARTAVSASGTHRRPHIDDDDAGLQQRQPPRQMQTVSQCCIEPAGSCPFSLPFSLFLLTSFRGGACTRGGIAALSGKDQSPRADEWSTLGETLHEPAKAH